MNNRILRHLELARKKALSKDDRRSYLLGAVAERADGTIVSAFNGPSYVPTRQAHAEYRLAKKLDYGATVYVVRVRILDGQFAIAKPCPRCMKALSSKRVKRVYYTVNECQLFDWMDVVS